ncbi:MAG: tetrahydrodipicolinate N-succinyltransferase N-terminal domain-containing protein [Acidimicrobiales bacterium]
MPTTVEEFQKLVATVEARAGYTPPVAYGIGVATLGLDDRVLDADFIVVNFEANTGTAAAIADVLGEFSTGSYFPSGDQLATIIAQFAAFEGDGKVHANVDALVALAELNPDAVKGHRRVPIVSVVTDLGDAPVDTGDVYLRLFLLSQRHVRPNGVSLEGAFGKLNNVVWSNLGPIDPDLYDGVRAAARIAGTHVHVYGVDKFPRMVDYVVPSGVRIADASRVRLGAYLGEGTVVMHEGFINFNAGTEGPNMVEGRISQGVKVHANADLGGGCSTMGTLSGGGTEIISVGERCLIGANAGIGLALGNDCTVEAGLYVTGGTPVVAVGLGARGDDATMKASEFSGRDNLLFRRNGPHRRRRGAAKQRQVGWPQRHPARLADRYLSAKYTRKVVRNNTLRG